MKINIFIAIINIPILTAHAQISPSTVSNSSSGWTRSAFENKVFIENKGQFNEPTIIDKGQILFGAEDGGTYIFYSQKGLTYRISKTDIDKEKYEEWMKEEQILGHRSESDKEHNREEELQRKMYINLTSFVQMEWLNADPNVKVLASDIATEYFNYGMSGDPEQNINFAKGYKKICYKDLYPGIDVVYTFHEKKGTKYSLIVHPGANVKNVKMKYTGDGKVKKNKEGNIIITTPLGDIVDHAPVTFYDESGKSIGSWFEVVDNVVSYNINFYDNTKMIIIDPWTVNPAFINNRAYDVNYDMKGNVYIYGSGSTTESYRLAKFDNTGTLKWVFATNWGWTLVGQLFYGDFAVDEISGTSYAMMNISTVIKVNTLGIQIGESSPGIFPSGFELFRCEYNRCLKKIVVGGGGTKFAYQSGLLDTSLTSFIPINSFSAVNYFHDVALLAIDPNSSFCYMATSRSQNNFAQFDNTMVKLPLPGLITPTWGPVNDGHAFREVNSIWYTPLLSGGYANGFNGMACGPTFLYTYDGNILKKWNKNTGAFISQINTGGLLFGTGGLSSDKCDNVYAGVGNLIKKYNSSLTLMATYSIPNTCYDIKLGPNNKLYACGAAFLTEIDVPALVPPTATSISATGCNACDGTATALPCGNSTGYTYLWSAGGQMTQTATGLCPGTYTVTITYACIDTNVVTVKVAGGAGGITLSSIQTNACSNVGSVTITAIGGTSLYTYLWSNGQTTAGLNGLSAGSYIVTVTDANGCMAVTTTNIIVSPPIIGQFTKGTANCTASGGCGCKEWIMITATGGTSPYSYTWPDGFVNRYKNQLCPGNYSINIKDKNGCSINVSLTTP